MAELRLNASQVQEAIDCFTAGKQPGFDLERELHELAQMPVPGGRDWLRVFLEIQVRAALAGNNLDGPVRPLLQQHGRRLGVSHVRARADRGRAAHPRGRFRAAGAAQLPVPARPLSQRQARAGLQGARDRMRRRATRRSSRPTGAS